MFPEDFIEAFPILMKMVLESKAEEQKRTDITRLTVALINQGIGVQDAVTLACSLYTIIESNVQHKGEN